MTDVLLRGERERETHSQFIQRRRERERERERENLLLSGETSEMMRGIRERGAVREADA